MRKPDRAEALLDRVEERARSRLASGAEGILDDLGSALGRGTWLRQHPSLVVAGVAALGAAVIARSLRSPRPARRPLLRYGVLRTARRWLVLARPPL